MPTNEVQVITLTAATGGTWTATYDGDETAALNFDAAAVTVQTALRGLGSVGGANVSVAAPGAGGPYTVTFIGELAETDVAEIEVDGTSLTGVGAAIAVETTVPGDPDLMVRDDQDGGVPMYLGESEEPQGPEDGLGVGEKRGDYSGRGDGSTHFEGGVLQSYGPHGDHSGEPDKKGGVTTTS